MIKKLTNIYKNLEYVADFNFPKYTTFYDCIALKLGKNNLNEENLKNLNKFREILEINQECLN